MSEQKEFVITRKKSAHYICVLPALAGVYLVIRGAVLAVNDNAFYAALSVAGAFLIIFGLMVFLSDALKKKKTPQPQVIIAYENGVLHFPDFDCTADKIVEVRGEGRLYHGIRHRWGKIRIVLEDRTVEYDYVDEVEIACERLIGLMQESKYN